MNGFGQDDDIRSSEHADNCPWTCKKKFVKIPEERTWVATGSRPLKKYKELKPG